MSRHVPERTCVACRAKRPQAELLRLRRTGTDWVPETGKGPRTGRGRYLCADSPACWQEKKLRRAFGAQAPALAQILATQTLATQTPRPTQPPPPTEAPMTV